MRRTIIAAALAILLATILGNAVARADDITTLYLGAKHNTWTRLLPTCKTSTRCANIITSSLNANTKLGRHLTRRLYSIADTPRAHDCLPFAHRYLRETRLSLASAGRFILRPSERTRDGYLINALRIDMLVDSLAARC